MKSSNDINEALEFISLLGPDHFTIKKACEDLLIDPSQLFPKALQDFISSSTSKEMANVWLKHYEARRKARLVVIAKHLITAQIFTPTKKKNRPYSSARRLSSHSITKSTSEDTQLETIKKNIIKKISIEKNLQKIKKADEKKRKELEERLLTKSCRSDRKMPFEKEKIFKQHDERIRGILQKKYKDIEEHERNAMSSMSFRKEEVRPSSVYFNTPQKRMSKVGFYLGF